MTFRYAFHGWTGSGRCAGCGNDVASGLAVWTEYVATPRCAVKEVVARAPLLVCIPCNHSLEQLPAGQRFLTVPEAA